jgi:hypothetical protein
MTRVTLDQLHAQLQEQALEVASLRAAFDVQFKRIAQLQAELDQLPVARKRRQLLQASMRNVPQNGDGRTHR